MKGTFSQLIAACLFAALTLCAAEKGNAQQLYNVRQYQTSQGLPHNTILCVSQDSFGYLWFGTMNGICCFDGQLNNLLHPTLDRENRTYDNNGITIMEDYQHRIWTGTSKGILIFDGQQLLPFDKVTKQEVKIRAEVSKIIETRNRLIWIATQGQGLFLYNPHTEELKQQGNETDFVIDLFYQGEILYALNLNGNIDCFDEDGQLINSIHLPDEQRNLSLFITDTDIWVGSMNRTLYRIEKTDASVRVLKLSNKHLHRINSIALYQNNLILGTDYGLFKLTNEETGEVESFLSTDSMPLLENINVNQVMIDPEEGIWAATTQHGLFYLSERTKRFLYYEDERTFNYNAFYPDEESQVLWIGTKTGLYNVDLQNLTGKLRIAKYPAGQSIIDTLDIRSLSKKGDELWIGTNGDGLYVINTVTDKIKTYKQTDNHSNALGDNTIQRIFRSKDGAMNIGTDWGFLIYNEKEDNFKSVIELGNALTVTDITEDNEGKLWIATYRDGLYIRNANRQWKHYDHANTPVLPNGSAFSCLFKDKDGTIWIGTNGSGLFCYKDHTFRMVNQGISWFENYNVYSITQDTNGAIWIATQNELISIDPENTINYQIYSTLDGLKGNYEERAFFCMTNGWMAVGESQGANFFNPANFAYNDYSPPTRISGIRLLDASSREESERLLGIKGPTSALTEIKIPFKYNAFSISLSALSYQNPDKNRFTYMLKGVDNDWCEETYNNNATYTKLKPGKYLFMVKASNNDIRWNEIPTQLLIIITPPWWQTWWGYLLHALAIIALLALLVWAGSWYLSRIYRKKVEDQLAKQEQDLIQSKIKFFVNLVHEIRTPLTLIKLPLESIKAQHSLMEQENVHIIEKNVNYLLGITNELLDFQKLENDSIQMNYASCNVKKVVDDILEQFYLSFQSKGIELKFNCPTDIKAIIDCNKFQKIMVNLLGNALKFANEKVIIELQQTQDNFKLFIDDDGSGIADEEKPKVFRSFYQFNNDKADAGTGLGLPYSLALAEHHQGNLTLEDSPLGGCRFVLIIPKKPTQVTELSKDDTFIPDDHSLSDSSLDITEGASSDIGNERKHILIVEDNEDMLQILAGALRQRYGVTTATNGQECLNVLEEQNIDLILSDVMMPVMDGFECCRIIRSNMGYSHIPIILLTAKVMLEAKVEGLQCGADVFMEKPFTLTQVFLQIRNLLESRAQFHRWMMEHAGIQLSQEEETTELTQRMTADEIAFVQEVDKLIQANIDEDLSIDTMSQKLNVSGSTLYRKIKALTGASPNDYIRHAKLNHAAQRIRVGVSIKTAYLEVGFISSSYFSKCFKAKFGVTPTEYKSKL